MFYKSFFFVTLVSSMAACSVNPSSVPSDYAQEFVNKATYAKDQRSGLCYAIVAKRMAMQTSQNVVSFTWVPCERVESLLVK